MGDHPDGRVSKLLEIQWLRGLAALSVAMLHAQHDAVALAARGGKAFAPLDGFAWAAGVDVFFVVSGFVMVHASRGLFGAAGARADFLSRRLARIVPLYWTVTTLYLGLALWASGLLNSAVLQPWLVIASYLFVPLERPDGTVQPLYSLGWTLNYEMFFYALFALTVVWPRRRAVWALLGLMGGLVVLGRLVTLPAPLAFWTDPIILEFAFGLALGALKAEGVRLNRPIRVALVIAGVALLALNPIPAAEAGGWARPLAWGLPAALLVAAAALGGDHAGSTHRTARLGGVVGDASYALYLVHPFVIRACGAIASQTGWGAVVGPWGFVAVSLVLAVVASLVVYRWFERPATDLARRWLEPVRSPRWSSP
jgi:peptidoglycan/LPS O-acetylase OafA/YrhL